MVGRRLDKGKVVIMLLSMAEEMIYSKDRVELEDRYCIVSA